jgi:amidase
MTDLALAPLTAVAQRLQTGDLSPVELTRHLLDRIARLDPRFHSYVTVLDEQAMAQARAAEADLLRGRSRGPLHGIPVAVKDLCCTTKSPTTCGAQMFRDWRPDADSTVVEKLAAAGAILLGKLHMTEFALRWHHPYRPMPTNPWGADRWPGVSSSGSGVATAAGLCYGAIGTDTGGSIRFPAAANGVVGLKPTYGRVSRAGVFPLAASLDHVGPLTRSVADAAAMLYAIAGYDPRDPTSSRLPVPDYVRAIEQGMTGVRLGVDERYLTVGVHPEVSQAVLAAVEVFKAQGAEIVAVTVPELAQDATGRAWYTITAAEALVAHVGFYPERAADYGPFRELLEDGTRYSAQAYAQAHQVREELSATLQGLFEHVDVVLCPTMPSTAPRMDTQGNALMAEGLVRTRYTFPWNFSRHPTLALPCGFDREGLPVSLQLVARHFAEEVLCRVGAAYEQATSWHTVRPPLLTD